MVAVDLWCKPSSELRLAGLAAREAFGTDIEGLAEALDRANSELTEDDFSFLVRLGRVLSLPEPPALRLVPRSDRPGSDGARFP